MANYRLYCLDGAGRIGLADWIEADDDNDATQKARKTKHYAVTCEIWQGTRLGPPSTLKTCRASPLHKWGRL